MRIYKTYNNLILLVFLLSAPFAFSQQEVIIKKKDTTYVSPIQVDHNSSLEVSKFKSNFKRKYLNDADFDYSKDDSTKEDNFIQRLLKSIDEFFARLFRPMDISYETINTTGKILRVLGIFFFLLIIYYVVRAFIQKDIYWGFKRKSKNINIMLEQAENDIVNTDFSALVQKMTQQNEYRICIRFYYLWLLQQLQEKKIIEWHIEKTNTDYYNEIKDTSTKEQFQYLSYLYNHIWYGEHKITKEEFMKAKNAFDQTLKTN
ncbi:DUF4129 domain-containing protein [Myroides pelagicus]|uniref:DUF4129 domain-containing protein n=1 Tax=Myroides pelagicus TaxID=270914 RepID=A0A7K1GNK7_9FLAO|nr:DUF4129 domain-containing protein [Myroides pelagicus]MEC4114695.1 DUF4129 domain-containing protein [Myroides pelagicus]MTH30465.1 DUF4129 domain-containing protein [Myroides pelagicus]